MNKAAFVCLVVGVFCVIASLIMMSGCASIKTAAGVKDSVTVTDAVVIGLNFPVIAVAAAANTVNQVSNSNIVEVHMSSCSFDTEVGGCGDFNLNQRERKP